MIEVKYIRTEDQLADILTENLPRVTFEKLRNQIMTDKIYNTSASASGGDRAGTTKET